MLFLAFLLKALLLLLPMPRECLLLEEAHLSHQLLSGWSQECCGRIFKLGMGYSLA